MNKFFGLGRAHEVLIWDLGCLERCKKLLMIGPGKQTQKKVERITSQHNKQTARKKSGHGFAPKSSPQRKERGGEWMFKDPCEDIHLHVGSVCVDLIGQHEHDSAQTESCKPHADRHSDVTA
jgi:hypothetical protein